jgi:hypothetical protein
LCRLCHDIGMIDIKKEDKSTSSFHAQSAQLAEGREDLIGGGDGLVLFSRLPVTHVTVDWSPLCRLPERSIVTQVASAKRCRSAAHSRSSLLIRTDRTVTRACSRCGRLHESPRCVLAWSIAGQPFLPFLVSPLAVEVHDYGEAVCRGRPLLENRSRKQARRQGEGARRCGTPRSTRPPCIVIATNNNSNGC